MDPRILKKTQDSLGKIIKKPPLTDKLLSKPPFRFLHDIVTSFLDRVLKTFFYNFFFFSDEQVMKQTGLMKGLFAEQELNSENVKDKESKVAFLQKALDYIAFVSGKSLGAKPSKIVAGHEPEKTNEFLQAIASAINAKVDNEESINRFLNKGSSKDKEKPKEKDDRKKREKDSEEKRDREKSRDREREKSRDREKEERRDREKSRDRDREERHRDERHRDREERHRERRKKVAFNDLDTATECWPADIGSGNSTDTDLELFGDASEMDSPLQHANALNCKISEIKNRDVANSTPYPSKGIKVIPEQPKTCRASRPGAAHPRKNRRPDQSYSNNKVDHQACLVESNQTSTRQDQSVTRHHLNATNPEGSGQYLSEGKKQKSGTKSGMTVRHKQNTKPTSSLGTDRPHSQKSVISASPKAEAKSVDKRRTHSKESLIRERRLSKTVSEKLMVSKKSKLKHTVPLASSSKSSPSKTKTRLQCESSKSRLPSHPVKEQREKCEDSQYRKGSKQQKHKREEEESKDGEAMVNGEKADGGESKMARPSSAKGSRRRREGRHQGSSDEEDETPQTRHAQPSQQPTVGEEDLPPQVAASRKLSRPSSARPAPPRRKQETIENEPAMRLGSGKPANVIVDADKDSDDDDDNFVVEESAPPPPDPEQTIKPEDSDDEDHGGLVKKILETKKELEGGNQPQQTRRTEVGKPPHTRKRAQERPTMTDAQRRKQREQVQKEIDKLRGSIQTLTRSANPLGKIMDYVQEDLDSMQKELERWKSENKEHSLALKRERGITDKAIEPLKAQLSEVDQAIKDQLDLIAAVKSNIIRNDQKTEKMLRSIAKS